MADRSVPIQSAVLKFDEDGNLKSTDPNATGGGGGTTSNETVVTDVDISSGDPTLLLAANSSRKGIIISSSQSFFVMFGGVDGEGVPIETGEEGAITSEHNSIYLSGGSNYESGQCLYKGAIVALAQTAGDAVHTVKVTEFI